MSNQPLTGRPAAALPYLRVYRGHDHRWRWVIERAGTSVRLSEESYRSADEAHGRGSVVLREMRKLIAG